MILLIGSDDDPQLLSIQERIGADCQLLSTNFDSLLKTQVVVDQAQSMELRCRIDSRDCSIRLADITAAFCLEPISAPSASEQSQTFRFWHRSWRETLEGMLFFLSDRRVLVNESLQNAIARQNKLELFHQARKADLDVPPGIVTNEIQAINRFIESQQDVVVKSLHQIPLEVDGESAMFLAKRVTKSDFADFAGNESPLFLQRYVDKKFDVRIVVAGETFLACRIDASRSDAGRVDWRAYDFPRTVHDVFAMPESYEERLRELMRLMHLDYACIDVCVDREDKFWLLDVNPFGRFLWMEKATGLAISDAVAQHLVGRPTTLHP